MTEAAVERATYSYHARVTETSQRVVQGDAVTVAAAAGDRALVVLGASPFNPTIGGLLRVRYSALDSGPTQDVVLAYTGWDGDDDDVPNDTIRLAAPLADAVPVDTPIDVWEASANGGTGGPAVVYELQVLNDDAGVDGKPVTAILDRTRVDTLPAETIPGRGTSVTVGELPGSDDLLVLQIHGGDLTRDGAYLDPATVPAPEGVVYEPTDPPASSPTLKLAGLPSALGLTITQAVDPSTRIQYHLSTVDGFTPSAATAVGQPTAAGVLVVNALTDGTPLALGTTYYARTVALNDVGAAQAGPQAQGALDINGIMEQFIASLTTGYILTGKISFGDGRAYIDANEGFVIPNPAPPGVEPTRTVFPFDGKPIDLQAMVTALTFTSTGVATFLALARVRRRLEVGDGISAPTEAPTVANHWPAVAAPGSLYGLIPHPSNAALWVGARSSNSGVTVRSWARTGESNSVVLFTTTAITGARGLTYAGGRYWVLGFDANQWKLVGVLATDTSDVIVRGLGASYLYSPALGLNNTGGALLVAYVEFGSGGGNQIRVATYNSSTGAPAIVHTIQQNVTVTDLAWVGQGTFNFGADRIVVQPADADAIVWSGLLSDTTRLPANAFPRALGGTVRGMAWDGTRFRSLVGAQVAAHASTRTVAESVTVAASWAGQTAGGVSIETNVGATRTATVAAQTQALVSTPAPPEADLGDPGKANRAAVYALVSGTQRRQGAVLPIGTRALVLDILSAAGRAAGATGTFDSSPADLVPERGATDTAKMWRLFGSGAGFISDLSWSAAGDWTLGTRFLTAIRSALGLSSYASGRTTIPFSNATVGTLAVTFPAGRFAAAPTGVTVTPFNGVVVAYVQPGTLTKDGMTIAARRYQGDASSVGIEVSWTVSA